MVTLFFKGLDAGEQKMPLITISRGMGCGGEAIADIVSNQLKLELFDDERLHREAVDMGIKPDEFGGLDEKTPGFWDYLWGQKPELYLDLMESVVYRGFCRFAFHMDWDDPSLYDLVINTDKIGIDGAAKLIMESATSSEIKECSLSALESMERMGLTKRVNAALLKNKVNLATLHVEVDTKGVVDLHGLISTKKGHDFIVETIKEVPGVSDIHSEVTIAPPAIA